MTTIYADNLQPGDVVDYHGHPHQVTHVDRRDRWAWPVAFDDARWALALGHDVVAVIAQPDNVSSHSRADSRRIVPAWRLRTHSKRRSSAVAR